MSVESPTLRIFKKTYVHRLKKYLISEGVYVHQCMNNIELHCQTINMHYSSNVFLSLISMFIFITKQRNA